jgi:nicotinamidase-related amidase
MSSPPQNHPSHHNPSATALLLLDYHSKYLDFIQDADAKSNLISAVKTLISTARANKIPILHCLIDTNKDPAPTSKLFERWHTTAKPAFMENPALVAEYPDFAMIEATPTFERTFLRRAGHISALKSDGLLSTLKDDLGVKSLIMCGLSSSGCLLSTARQASDEDFVVGIVEDGCWDSKPDMHKAVMEGLLAPHAWTLGLDEAVRILGGDGVSL